MKRIAIVDAYSAGNLLAPEFKARGIECIHVQSTPNIWEILLPTFRPDDFVAKLTFRGDIAALAEELRPYGVEAILPGTETGVEISDALSEALSLPTNGTARSAARRNKYVMVETVRASGLKAARQFKSSRVPAILEWFAASGIPKIVIKPLESAGTDSVAICTTQEQAERACHAILGTVNKLGLENREVLAQEFLEGTEYFINTVSRAGHHHVTEIWEYQKRSINGHDCVYDRNKLLPHDGETQTALREYVLGVLNALGVAYGAAHTEVIMTPSGPALVEIGTRLDGLSVPGLNRECVGYSAVDLTVDAYADADAFAAKTKAPYVLKKHSLTVYLTSYREGTVKSVPGEQALRELPSFFQMRVRVKPGGRVPLTVDYFTAPGFVTLVHPDPAVLEKDFQAIREMEKQDLIEYAT